MNIELNMPESQKPVMLNFNTTEELLNLEQIKIFSTHANFHRFSIGGDLLMAEFKDGSSWFVLGTINGEVNLPKWEPKYDSLMDTKKLVRDLQGNLTLGNF